MGSNEPSIAELSRCSFHLLDKPLPEPQVSAALSITTFSSKPDRSSMTSVYSDVDPSSASSFYYTAVDDVSGSPSRAVIVPASDQLEKVVERAESESSSTPTSSMFVSARAGPTR